MLSLFVPVVGCDVMCRKIKILIKNKMGYYLKIFIWWQIKLGNIRLQISPNVNYCEVSVAQSCPTVCDPVDGSPSGSSIHGILQARVLEWVVISFSRIIVKVSVIMCATGILRV